MSEWMPIESAPKGGGAEDTRDPAYVEPPEILLLFPEGKQCVCSYDWYYAEDGNGYQEGVSAWVEPVSGEQIEPTYGNPTHWMPLPTPPKEQEDA